MEFNVEGKLISFKPAIRWPRGKKVPPEQILWEETSYFPAVLVEIISELVGYTTQAVVVHRNCPRAHQGLPDLPASHLMNLGKENWCRPSAKTFHWKRAVFILLRVLALVWTSTLSLVAHWIILTKVFRIGFWESLGNATPLTYKGDAMLSTLQVQL